MRVGLIDVDGHHFPNLALMKLSAWHKAKGDTVEWWWSDLCHYDLVYMSKVFSSEYTPDVPEPMNADKVKIGKLNYYPSNIDWKEFGEKAEELCQRLCLDYYIKESLREEMNNVSD